MLEKSGGLVLIPGIYLGVARVSGQSPPNEITDHITSPRWENSVRAKLMLARPPLIFRPWLGSLTLRP
jgi:hypothetical protein